jgi:MoaA/NifB/PqqE/SkfB family radical SAM enzyme
VESAIQQPHIPPARRHWTKPLIYRALRGWLFPYIESRLLPGEFHPIICYLFTEYKCNLDCHYCWAFDNHVVGMTEDVAKRSIDWLQSTTCRVLALMGGEPLLRPAFVHKVIYYAAKKGCWIYLPTNGRLMRPEVMDRILDAGVATVNLAVDAVHEKAGLPKALTPIRRNFEYLVRRQYGYGATVFFNINICRNNLDDVKALTEIAHDHGIATDYHINESPMLNQENFNHLEQNPTFIRPEDWPKVDEVLDWLIDKNRSGYKMVNSTTRLGDMKRFMRGALQSWECRAGQNSLIIRVDGTLAPCFPMYSSGFDWGAIGSAGPLRELRDLKGDALVAGILGLVRRSRPLHVSIVGKEPLVRYRELEVLLPKLEDMGVEVLLVTSASRPIPASWQDLSNLYLAVSIDGLQPEHDRRRAPATYGRILEHIAGHEIFVHCTLTRQLAQRPDYLNDFTNFWSKRQGVRRIWFSLYTPQEGEQGDERLTPQDRVRALGELSRLRLRYPLIEMPDRILDGFLHPPASPQECIFAQTTACISADLATPITPCQYPGTGDKLNSSATTAKSSPRTRVLSLVSLFSIPVSKPVPRSKTRRRLSFSNVALICSPRLQPSGRFAANIANPPAPN